MNYSSSILFLVQGIRLGFTLRRITLLCTIQFIFKQQNLLSTSEHSHTLDKTLITFCFKHDGHDSSSSDKFVSNKFWSVLPKAQTAPSLPVTEVFPKQYISIIIGCYQAQLGEEERDVCLADSFIGKCLFRVGLSAWLPLLLGSHFSLLALYQLSFTSVSKPTERDKKESARELQRRCLYHGTSSGHRAGLRRLPLWESPGCNLRPLFRNHQLWGVLPHSRGDGGQEGGWDGDAEERQNAAATRWEEDGEAQSQTAHRWWPWVWACKSLWRCRWCLDGFTPVSYFHIDGSDSTPSSGHVLYHSSLIHCMDISKFNEITTVIFCSEDTN